ncbi:hypothetical protein ACRAKI_05370 [Saccharothrix isguenensis]
MIRTEFGPLELFGVPAPTMFTIVSGVGTLFWVAAYVLIIRKGFQDRSFGMPIAALCANISCEAIFSFVYPAEGLLRLSNYTWFAVDLAILYQILKFAPVEFPHRSRVAIWAQVAVGIVVAGWCQIAFIREFNDYGGAYVIYGVNLLMSSVFIAMVQQRRSARGQSMGIAVSKMVGTGLFSVTLFLFSRDDFARGGLLTFLYVACFALDLMYCVILRRYIVAGRTGRESHAVEESDKVLAS